VVCAIHNSGGGAVAGESVVPPDAALHKVRGMRHGWWEGWGGWCTAGLVWSINKYTFTATTKAGTITLKAATTE
jgi:hypothetical protein